MADSEEELTKAEEEVEGPQSEQVNETETPNTQPKPPTQTVSSRKTQKGGGVQVDLTKIKTKTVLHIKPSLPTPLTHYGLDEKKQARAKARAEKEPREKKRKRSSTFYSDDERDKEKERQRDEKYMQVLDDLRKLRNYYYSEYRDMLDTKVERQRKEIRTKTEAQQRKQKEQEDREREASHRVKKRLDHHKLKHDENYLKNVPKSDVYLILGLQEKLVKEGKLRSQDDLDRFWMEMRKPDIFFSHFPNGLSTTAGLNNRIASSRRSTTEEMPPRTLSQIAESRETSRPQTHETWAVTQRFHHIHPQGESSTSLHKSVSMSPSKQAAMELERRFPKLEMPPLHCFNMDLGEKPPDPEEIQLKLDLKVREKQRRKFLKKLHKMHQLAMANSAAATRILDSHTDLAFLLEGPQLTDLISDYYWDGSHPIQPSRPAPQHEQLPPLSAGAVAERELERARIHEESLEISPSRNRPLSESSKSIKDRDVGQQLVVYEPPKPFPLTMEEVKEKNRVIEAKILSSFWTNYMQTGKSTFLTSSS